jgi:hypothetical protein
MKNLILIFTFLQLVPMAALAQGNSFNFQGRLNDGTDPANGRYDLQFRLYDAVAGGSQIGALVSRHNTILINGVFSVSLDFGAAAFNGPNSIFIEIAIRPNGSPNAFTILGPRQQLTVVPFAVRAMNATNADNAVIAQNAANSALLGGLPATEYVTKTNGGTDFIRNSTAIQPNSNFSISGTGSINGNLNVVGNTIINGNNTIGGNAIQNRDKNGFVKAMIYVNADSTILRCYNAITNSSIGSCGFNVSNPGSGGHYFINFGFQVNDRFIAVTPRLANGVNISTSYAFDSYFQTPLAPSEMVVVTCITDVDNIGCQTPNPFVVIVY